MVGWLKDVPQVYEGDEQLLVNPELPTLLNYEPESRDAVGRGAVRLVASSVCFWLQGGLE